MGVRGGQREGNWILMGGCASSGCSGAPQALSVQVERAALVGLVCWLGETGGALLGCSGNPGWAARRVIATESDERDGNAAMESSLGVYGASHWMVIHVAQDGWDSPMPQSPTASPHGLSGAKLEQQVSKLGNRAAQTGAMWWGQSCWIFLGSQPHNLAAARPGSCTGTPKQLRVELQLEASPERRMGGEGRMG